MRLGGARRVNMVCGTVTIFRPTLQTHITPFHDSYWKSHDSYWNTLYGRTNESMPAMIPCQLLEGVICFCIVGPHHDDSINTLLHTDSQGMELLRRQRGVGTFNQSVGPTPVFFFVFGKGKLNGKLMCSEILVSFFRTSFMSSFRTSKVHLLSKRVG